MRKKQILAIALIWLGVVGVAFSYAWHRERLHSQELALETARAFFQQIVNTRSWNAGHGGVYVPVTAKTQPNPYLHDPARDLTTTGGLRLTLVNPAYMTREIAEIADRREGIHFHITSLKPIRPANAPAPWEAASLHRFEDGARETGEFITVGSRHQFRYMAPLIVTDPCLKCHAAQGYKLGDIRGGISITIPHSRPHVHPWLLYGYGIAALGGLIFILLGGTLLRRKNEELEITNRALAGEIVERRQTQEKAQRQSDFLKTLIDSLPHPFYVIDAENYAVVMANAASAPQESNPATTCHQLIYHRDTPCDGSDNPCPLVEIKKSGHPCSVEHVHLNQRGEREIYEIQASPVFDEGGKLRQIIEYQIDISARKRIEEEREGLIRNLTEANEKVKTLSGIVPICMYCKGIRDDQGYWNKLEAFIAKYSEAQFSHSICPKCLAERYPENDKEAGE